MSQSNGHRHAPAPPVELLRFSTAGSVDDGKSTLIGRLLYETKSIFEDQLAEVERASQARGGDYINLALLTDGLRAEREQGITIDVAYRYFATPRRKFIVADTPGHVQYTRNMVTGTSTADVAVVLVDAVRGITEQSRRHAAIAALVRVPHLTFCINKMDLVGYDQVVHDALRDQLHALCERLEVASPTVIPIAALHGDNVVERSGRMPWYRGPALLEHLETVPLASSWNLREGRFPVQWVNRPLTAAHPEYRGYAGQVAGGVLRPGESIVVYPSGLTTRIKSIDTFEGTIEAAYPPMSVTLTLDTDLDVSRGDMICPLDNPPTVGQTFDAMLCWLATTSLRRDTRYLLKHTTRVVKAMVSTVHYRADVNAQIEDRSATTLGLNDIGRVTVRTTQPIFYDAYARNRTTGSFILIDESTNETSAAGMIL